MNLNPSLLQTREVVTAETGSVDFTEAAAWRDVGVGWQPLFGSFRGLGYSIEWHDFVTRNELDWSASFHPGCVELCLNLEGCGIVEAPNCRATYGPNTAGFYCRGTEPLKAHRGSRQRHRFLTVEFSPAFLGRHLGGVGGMLDPLVRGAVDGLLSGGVCSTPVRLTAAQQQMISSLRHPPVYSSAQPIWYQCKALELAVTFLLRPSPDDELFCTRQQRQAQERVDKVILLLNRDLANPPSLEELGRTIGCSHYYLSRIFSNHTGQTITQYLRRLRMERAAELLRSGRFNVTEAAVEVGYSSLSHFSQAFHETFGCCPGLYPVATSTQRSARNP